MKKTFKILSNISLVLFGVLWLLSKFPNSNDFNSIDIRSVLVLIYLFTNLRYHQIQLEEKNLLIKDLTTKLNEK